MNSIILVEVFLMSFLDAGTCMWYLRYSNSTKSWKNATEHCKSLNGSIFTVDIDNDAVFQNCSFYKDISPYLWTGRIKVLSKWTEKNFCYKYSELRYDRRLIFENLKDPYACQHYCENSTHFAYREEKHTGICLCSTKKMGDEHQAPLCEGDRNYRFYTNWNETVNSDECTGNSVCRCVFTRYRNGRHYLSSKCDTRKDVQCTNEVCADHKKNWTNAKQFCIDINSMLQQANFLQTTDEKDIWTGISKEYSFVWYENIMSTTAPIKCSVYVPYDSFLNVDCTLLYPFVCKKDMPFADMNDHDCIIPFHSTTSTTFSTTSKSLDISSMETTIKTTEINTSTYTDKMDNESTTSFDKTDSSTTDETIIQTKQSTETKYTDVLSTHSIAERSTYILSPETEGQHQDLTYILTGTIAGTFAFLLVAIVLIRRKILSNKYKKHEEGEETEKPAVSTTKRSPLPVGSSNVSGGKSDVYCDPWQSFEESQRLTNAGKKLNRQSQNPMYELNSLQYDSYSVAGGLTMQNNTEKYENVNLDIYNHCNVGGSKMAASQQNVYDSAAGIYSHLNHGGNTDHNEDTYDHFHGSDQDYDQFDRTLRNTKESEYSIYH